MKEYNIISKLVNLAIEDPVDGVRRKAIRAISSTARNYQPGLDSVIYYLPREQRVNGKLDASDMGSVDQIIEKLRNRSESMKKS